MEQDRNRRIYRVTLLGSVVNMLLLIAKFAAGILGHSAAMIADAVHSLSDFVTDVIVLVFVRLSNKPADDDHAYGHGKYETIATSIIGIALFAVACMLGWEGLTKIYAFCCGEQLQSPGQIALAAAIISILSKEWVYRITRKVAYEVESSALEANAWHHRSDALSSIGTALGIGGAIFLGGSWRILDPIAAIVVSIFIIRVAYKLLTPCIDELLERSLPPETEKHILDIILATNEVTAPHHLCTRRIGNQIAIEVHVRMDGNTTLFHAHEVASGIERRLRNEFGPNTHVGIHMEPVK